MSDPAEIRRLIRKDLSTVLPMWMRLMRSGQGADSRFRVLDDAEWAIEEYARQTWTRNEPFPHGFVAESCGNLVGFVVGVPRQLVPVLDSPQTVQITDLWVEPAYRRCGLGKALVNRFQAECRQVGFTVFEVSTLVADARALAFWRQQGFDDWTIRLTTQRSRGDA